VSHTILVVDDEEDIRFLTRQMLRLNGYEVLEAPSGEEALDILKGATPDLMLLDIRMKGIDGFEVLNRVRLSPNHSRLPIVMMSAHSSPSTLERAAKEGSSRYLIKPFKERELLVALSELLDETD
jgi:CheY-like chemotaxis protein